MNWEGEGKKQRLLVYDLETYATGFADPNWVPQVVTCVGWKWLGEEGVSSSVSIDHAEPGSMPHLQPEAIQGMLEPFLAELDKADGVVVYNGRRFDNPVLNGMMWYLGRPPLDPILTYDLHEFGRVKGVKKGLDNVAIHLGASGSKLGLSHAQWTAGYLEKGWPTIKRRARDDVLLTEETYYLKKESGWVKPPRMWKP